MQSVDPQGQKSEALLAATPTGQHPQNHGVATEVPPHTPGSPESAVVRQLPKMR